MHPFVLHLRQLLRRDVSVDDVERDRLRRECLQEIVAHLVELFLFVACRVRREYRRILKLPLHRDDVVRERGGELLEMVEREVALGGIYRVARVRLICERVVVFA